MAPAVQTTHWLEEDSLITRCGMVLMVLSVSVASMVCSARTGLAQATIPDRLGPDSHTQIARNAYAVQPGATVLPVIGAAPMRDPQSSGAEPNNLRFRLGIGAFTPLGNFSPASASTGFGLLGEYLISPGSKGDVVLSFGLDYYSASLTQSGVSVSGNDLLIPFMVEYQFHIGDQGYIGAGLGIVSEAATASTSGLSISGSTTDFAYTVDGGYNFHSLFAELRYMGGSSEDVKGLMIAIGGRF